MCLPPPSRPANLHPQGQWQNAPAGYSLLRLEAPTFGEDRIVQDRLSGILQAIWEPEFRDCSYGFRPGRNAHQALKRLGEVITQACQRRFKTDTLLQRLPI